MLYGAIKAHSYSQPVPQRQSREAARHEERPGNTKGLKEQEPSAQPGRGLHTAPLTPSLFWSVSILGLPL